MLVAAQFIALTSFEMATTDTRLEPVHRRSLRLEGYDYTLVGGYFVTVCTQDRICSLATIHGEGVDLTDAGSIALETWLSLATRFSFVDLDTFVVMPNHIHGIIVLADPSPAGREHAPKSLGWVIRTFKAASTSRIRRSGASDFAWQRDYYDHIVRNEAELGRIREYIAANPMRWDKDPENVALVIKHRLHQRNLGGRDCARCERGRPV